MIKKQLETEKDLNVTQGVRELAARHASARLLEAARQTPQEVFAAYETTPQGQPRPDIMRALFGRNELARKKADSILKRLFKAFINPFTVVLIVLAVISFITDYVIVEPEERDLTAVLIVGIMVFISGTLRFVQEVRSGNAAERLQAMVKTTIAVLRDGESRERPISELVVGDVIRLAAGDMIPADVRIVETKDLFVSQSSLTGESEPMEKWTAAQPQTGGNPLECNNLAFMGSTVVSGSALALVIAVGKDTLFGALARRVAETRVRTNFEKGVNAVSWVLIRFMVGMVPVVLFLNGFTKGDWVQAALFALSVAVGLTPEMLPMIVSANLAKGAVAMSRKKVIVKHLNAIQNLGAMNILCTDKTGTLTQDRIVLEYPLDVHGNVDERVLRHAFLNSYHQTGLRNLMDEAIAVAGLPEGGRNPVRFYPAAHERGCGGQDRQDADHHQGRGGGNAFHLQLRGIQGECRAAHQRVERGDPRHGAAVQRGRAARHRRGPQDESDGRRSVFCGGRVGHGAHRVSRLPRSPEGFRGGCRCRAEGVRRRGQGADRGQRRGDAQRVRSGRVAVPFPAARFGCGGDG